jgi:hypothetical protein
MGLPNEDERVPIAEDDEEDKSPLCGVDTGLGESCRLTAK